MTVKELAAWLAAFHDQDAIVEVVCHTDGTGYYDQGGRATNMPFNPEKYINYTDLRLNQWVPQDAPNKNERTLLLGELNG